MATKKRKSKHRITLASFWDQDCQCPHCETGYHWKAIVLLDGRPIAMAGNSGEDGETDVEPIAGASKRFKAAAKFAETCPAGGLGSVVEELAAEKSNV